MDWICETKRNLDYQFEVTQLQNEIKDLKIEIFLNKNKRTKSFKGLMSQLNYLFQFLIAFI